MTEMRRHHVTQMPHFQHPRFEILGFLGEGGMGVVYAAHDKETGMDVALKTVQGGSLKELLRLKQEFRTARDLHHPNLVRLYDLFVDADAQACFFTMELLHGRDFLEYVWDVSQVDNAVQHAKTTRKYAFKPSGSEKATAETTLDVISADSDGSGDPDRVVQKTWSIPQGGVGPFRLQQEAVAGFGSEAPKRVEVRPELLKRLRLGLEQLLSAISVLHAHGIVHQDLKPSNIMVTEDGRVVVLDFGVSSQLAALGHGLLGKGQGTPIYMSPEQANGEPVGFGTDLYSLGVVLYEALSGQAPFSGPVAISLYHKLTRKPQALKERSPDSPDQWCALIERWLSRHPEDRPGIEEGRQLLGVQPALARSAPVSSASWVSRGDFVGRGAALGLLQEALGRSSKSGVVLLEGNSGVGKTALAQRFCGRAAQDGFLVLESCCHPQESVPFNALDALVDGFCRFLEVWSRQGEGGGSLPLLAALCTLFPVLGDWVEDVAGRSVPEFTGTLVELRREAFEQFRTFLGWLAQRHDLLIFIDDLHWADQDSRVFLAQLFAGEPIEGVRWLLSFRPEGRAAAEFVTQDCVDGCHSLVLGPLDDNDARALFKSVSALDSLDDFLKGLVHEAQGSPFLLRRVASHIRGCQRNLPCTDLASDVLEASIAQELEQLSPLARLLVQMVAVAYEPLKARLLASAASEPPAMQKELRFLLKARLLKLHVGHGRCLSVYHDRLREFILAGIEPGVLRLFHKRLAEALEKEHDTQPGVLAFHWAEAKDARRACDCAHLAGIKATETLAFERAVRFFRLALEHDDGDDAERSAQLQRDLARALTSTGHSKDAARGFLQAAALSNGELAESDRHNAARLFIQIGDFKQGLDILREILERVSVWMPRWTPLALWLALWWRAVLWWRGLRFELTPSQQVPYDVKIELETCWTVATALGYADSVASYGIQSRHLLMALRVGEPIELARALSTELLYTRSMKDNPQAVHRLQQCLERVEPWVVLPQDQAYLALVRGYASFQEGHFIDARSDFELATRLYQQIGYERWERHVLRVHQLSAAYHTGRLNELEEQGTPYLEALEARADHMSVAMLRLGAFFAVDLKKDDVAVARQNIDATVSWFSGGTPPTLAFLEVWSRACVALYDGNIAEATQLVEQAWGPLRAQRTFRVVRVVLFWLRAHCAMAQAFDSPQLAKRKRKLASRCVAVLRREDAPWVVGLTSCLEATMALWDAEPTQAQRFLERAVEMFTQADSRVLAAAAQRACGELSGNTLDVHAGNKAMTLEGIVNPDRWMRLVFSRPEIFTAIRKETET